MTTSVSQSEAAYFDDLVARKGKFNPFRRRGWRMLERRFLQWNDQRDLNLLDVGCGTGHSRKIYISRCRRYTGLDLSETAISVAKKRYPDSSWFVANAVTMPFGDGTFDAVAFSSVLHHIPNYVEALREAHRVVRPGGMVFAYDPNLLHPAMALFRWPKSPLYSANGVSPNERPLLPKELTEAFRAAGFVNLRQRCQSGIPYRAVAPRLLNFFLTLYNAADFVMAVSQIDRIFGTFVLTAGRRSEE